jgi:hypothetical protein
MIDWSDILGQVVHGPELWQSMSEPDPVGVANGFSITFFAAVLQMGRSHGMRTTVSRDTTGI